MSTLPVSYTHLTRAWDEAIYDATQKALDGTLESGLLSYGISDGMLQAERAGSNVPVSDEIMADVAAYSQRVSDGSLKLPTTLEEVDPFLAGYAE